MGTAAPPSGTNACDAYLFERFNDERRNRGIAPIRWDDELHEIPTVWSGRMRDDNRLSHNNNYRAQLSERGRNPTRVGETVASGGTALAMADAWMASDPHRDILLDARYSPGVTGCVEGFDGVMWATYNLHSG